MRNLEPYNSHLLQVGGSNLKLLEFVTGGWVKNFLAHYMVMSVWVDINGIWVSCNDAAFFCR
ncbi:hypothetical protein SLEP1_g26503 [Rubroshorea leprosula]|uniref:Uncharacterized protein n=1 Tax=Rubroshorea leprosula TaxID=152421 RepID=A0AAV5JYG5_9ROSI|nr:hypothetical protein SLEP1_g26503 [Rubroshorea leprosula]